MKNTKTTTTLLALAVVGNLLLCSCTKTVETTSAPTETAEETTTATTTVEETEETTYETTKEMPHVFFSTNYEEITLDGNPDSHFVTTDYCYLESEKYYLLMEAGLDLPGDFAANVDMIIDELEKELGMELMTPDYDYSLAGIIDNSIYYDGFNPWFDWKLGTKLPIFLMVDTDFNGWVSCGDGEFACIVDYGLYSDDGWNEAVPNCPYEIDRPGYIDYSVIAHELTHSITDRCHDMNSIMTEGIASYMERHIIDVLADQNPAFAVVRDNRYLYDYGITEAVNAENSERLFIESYEEDGGPQGCAEYVHGRYFCEFLLEQYGEGFLLKYMDEVKKYTFENNYGYFTAEEKVYLAEAMKSAFGEDIFVRFGDWCVANNVLQELDGIFPIPEY